MIYYIYKLNCLNSDDSYIGRTSNIRRRMYVHDSSLKSCDKKMYQTIRDNGGYEYEILDQTDNIDEAKELERYYFEAINPSLNKNYPNRKSKEYYQKFYNEKKEYFSEYYRENKYDIQLTRKKYYLRNREFFKTKNLMNYYNKKGKKPLQTTITYGPCVINFD